MQIPSLMCLSCALAAMPAAGEEGNPLGKVIELLTSLQGKIIHDGEVENSAYNEYYEWCDDATKTKANEVKTTTSKKDKLNAVISKAVSDADTATARIGELVSTIADADAELKNATLIRETEHANFASAEQELMQSIDSLDRALSILEKEMAKTGASLLQVDTANMRNLVQSMSAIVDAAGMPGNDRDRLLQLVQTSQGGAESDEDSQEDLDNLATLGAPASSQYEGHSKGIIEVIEDLKDKAESELADLRKAETTAKFNYGTLKQSIEDSLAADNKELAEEKAILADAQGAKAVAEGELASTLKDLKDAQDCLATIQHDCMQVASDHEHTTKGREEELAALAKAKKVVQATSAGGASFLQVSSRARVQVQSKARVTVVNLIKKLARQHHSHALAQLASKVSAILRYGARSGDDPFEKVKGLINELIAKLMKEAQEEATEKAFCDDQMAKTEEKKAELEEDIAKLSAKIDKMAAASTGLKEDVRELQAELAKLAANQKEADEIRTQQHSAYDAAKDDLNAGLNAVRKGLTVLRNYYGTGEEAELIQKDTDQGDDDDGQDQFNAFMQQPAVPEKHEKSSGAGGTIIGILEVVESDFANELAVEEAEEQDAVAEYNRVTQENKVTTKIKDQDVKYKTQEFKTLDKEIAQSSADKDTASTELTAVMEYYGKLKDRCIAKAESYSERKRRREAEIAGLKEALEILQGSAAMLQGGQSSLRR